MKTKRILSIALTLVMLLGMLPGMNLTAYAANNLTIYIMDMLENMDDNEWGYQLYDGDVSIAEGTYVQINMGTWHTGVMNIYMNGEVVYTKPSGSLYKDDVYHFTAGPNCKILGGYQNMFDWEGNPNVYITQDASVAVTGVTLNPNTAQTIDVGGSVAFTATVEPAGASDKTVKWSVGGTNADAVKLYSDSACTTEVGADATDKLTVYAKGESAGSATVTATSNADSTKSASCDVTVNAAQTQTEELLTTITATGKEQANYSTANVATVSFSYTAGGSSAYLANWGWWGYGWIATVTPADGYTITKCVFYDDANRTATDSEAPFVVETTEEDKTPKVNGTPILAYTSKGIKKIEVYGYATPAATHSVTITAGDHMTKTADSGDAEQTGLTGAMTDVVYTADNGYYYPTDYSVAEVSGIKVTRDSYTQITVSGTPTADAAIALTAPTAKTTPDAPTTAAATDCTTADNNDGKLTGVTTAMEYKKSDADSWTAGTGSDITDLVPGTYYVRIKATDTTNASANQELTIKGFISYTVTFKVVNGKWNEGEGDAATADKTVTLTGHDGDTLKLTADQIPAVGTKPNDTYKAGSWDTTPSTDTAITAATTYTYTYAQKDSISQTVTFKVVNGKWDDDSTADKTVTLTGYEGDTLKLAANQIPAVGTKPNTNYKAGSWDVTPSAETEITGATTYTYTYAQKDSISQTVTFKVVNGSWNDETTTDKTVTLTGYEGDTLKLAATDIPAVGTKPNDTYKAGSWDTTPSADTAITAATTYTYTYAAKEASVVTKAPTAKTLTYTGSAQALVTAGEATGGTMQYALGTATEATEPYTTSIPTATDAGTYYVWYKVAGDENHNDTNPACVEVTINKATPTYTAPIGLTATYGDTLSGVTLPTGWAWVDSTQSVGNVGTNTFKANFTPADINNFNTISGIDVKVTVGKTAGKTAVISTDTMTYNYSSIYIEGVEGHEYIIVPKGTAVTDADWNTSVKPDPERDNWVFFENLKEATEYEIYARTAETETAFASDAVKANVYTTLSSIGYLYDSTLVGASITVEPEPNVEGLTYKWYQDEVTEDGEGIIHHILTEITGATGSTYTFRAEDAGKHIAVKIFAGDSEVGDFATDAPVASTAKVIFESNGGSDVETLTDAAYQSKIKAPADPTREGFAFDGWYWDEEFETPFDFEKDVITWTETTLYAKWTPNDYKITSVTGLTGANNKQWTKGGKDAVVITVKVSGEDNSFDHFTGVKLDGKELVKDVDYTVEKGSTVVTLKPETLEKLSVGEHTVTVLFDNGEVNTTLTVLAANSQDATSPQTGDNSHMGLWIALMMFSLCGIAATLLYGRKKRVFGK